MSLSSSSCSSSSSSSPLHLRRPLPPSTVFISYFLHNHAHEVSVKFPFQVRGDDNQITVYHNFIDLLLPVDVRFEATQHRLLSLLETPIYLSKLREPEMMEEVQFYLNQFEKIPCSSVDINTTVHPSRRYLVILDEKGTPPDPSSLKPADRMYSFAQGRVYFMTWIEKLMLIVITLFIGTRFRRQKTPLVMPGAITTLIHIGRFIGSRFSPSCFVIPAAKETDPLFYSAFSPILNFRHWQFLRDRNYVPRTPVMNEKGEELRLRTSQATLLYVVLLFAKIKREQGLIMGFQISWIRMMLLSHDKNAEYYRDKDQTIVGMVLQRYPGYDGIHNELLAFSFAFDHYLETGSEHHLPDPERILLRTVGAHFRDLIPDTNQYSTYIRDAVTPGISVARWGALAKVLPHRVEFVTAQNVLHLLVGVVDFVIVDKIYKLYFRTSVANGMKDVPQGNALCNKTCFAFIRDQYSVTLEPYIRHVLGFVFDVSHDDQSLHIYDIYNNHDFEMQVLCILPRECMLLLNYHGLALSIRNYHNVPSPAIQMMMAPNHLLPSLVNPLRTKMFYQVNNHQRFRVQLYPVMAFLWLLLSKDPTRMRKVEDKEVLLHHCETIGLLIHFLLDDNAANAKQIGMDLIGSIILMWMILPLATECKVLKANHDLFEAILPDQPEDYEDFFLAQRVPKEQFAAFSKRVWDSVKRPDRSTGPGPIICLDESIASTVQVARIANVQDTYMKKLHRYLVYGSHVAKPVITQLTMCMLVMPIVSVPYVRAIWELIVPSNSRVTVLSKTSVHAEMRQKAREPMNTTTPRPSELDECTLLHGICLAATNVSYSKHTFEFTQKCLWSDVDVPHISVMNHSFHQTLLLPGFVHLPHEIIHPVVTGLIQQSKAQYTPNLTTCPLFVSKTKKKKKSTSHLDEEEEEEEEAKGTEILPSSPVYSPTSPVCYPVSPIGPSPTSPDMNDTEHDFPWNQYGSMSAVATHKASGLPLDLLHDNNSENEDEYDPVKPGRVEEYNPDKPGMDDASSTTIQESSHLVSSARMTVQLRELEHHLNGAPIHSLLTSPQALPTGPAIPSTQLYLERQTSGVAFVPTSSSARFPPSSSSSSSSYSTARPAPYSRPSSSSSVESLAYQPHPVPHGVPFHPASRVHKVGNGGGEHKRGGKTHSRGSGGRTRR